MADWSYDNDDLRLYIVAQGAEPVIPGQRNRREPIAYDRVLYRERNIVERSIGWLKQGRRMVTRYEKTAASYPGFVLFAAVRQRLCNPLANVHTPWLAFGMGRGKDEVHSEGNFLVFEANQLSRALLPLPSLEPISTGLKQSPIINGGVACHCHVGPTMPTKHHIVALTEELGQGIGAGGVRQAFCNGRAGLLPAKIRGCPAGLCSHWAKSSRHPTESATNPSVIRYLRARNLYQRG